MNEFLGNPFLIRNVFWYCKYSQADAIGNVCKSFRNEKVCIEPKETLKQLIRHRNKHHLIEKILICTSIKLDKDVFNLICKHNFRNKQLIQRVIAYIETHESHVLSILSDGLPLAVESSNHIMVDLLLQNKYVSVYASLLENISEKGDFEMMRLVLKKHLDVIKNNMGVRINKKGSAFDRGLICAIQNRHFRVIEMLCKYVTKPCQIIELDHLYLSKYRWSWGIDRNMEKIIQLLLNKGIILPNLHDTSETLFEAVCKAGLFSIANSLYKSLNINYVNRAINILCKPSNNPFEDGGEPLNDGKLHIIEFLSRDKHTQWDYAIKNIMDTLIKPADLRNTHYEKIHIYNYDLNVIRTIITNRKEYFPVLQSYIGAINHLIVDIYAIIMELSIEMNQNYGKNQVWISKYEGIIKKLEEILSLLND